MPKWLKRVKTDCGGIQFGQLAYQHLKGINNAPNLNARILNGK